MQTALKALVSYYCLTLSQKTSNIPRYKPCNLFILQFIHEAHFFSLDYLSSLLLHMNTIHYITVKGPVVQSAISLMSLLVIKILTV